MTTGIRDAMEDPGGKKIRPLWKGEDEEEARELWKRFSSPSGIPGLWVRNPTPFGGRNSRYAYNERIPRRCCFLKRCKEEGKKRRRGKRRWLGRGRGGQGPQRARRAERPGMSKERGYWIYTYQRAFIMAFLNHFISRSIIFLLSGRFVVARSRAIKTSSYKRMCVLFTTAFSLLSFSKNVFVSKLHDILLASVNAKLLIYLHVFIFLKWNWYEMRSWIEISWIYSRTRKIWTCVEFQINRIHFIC